MKRELEMPESRRRRWTDEDLAFLVASMDQPQQEVADYLGRTVASVEGQRHLVRRGRTSVEPQPRRVGRLSHWSDAEDGYLQDNWGLPLADQAEELGRSVASIAHRRQRLMSGTAGTSKFWTNSEIEIILDHPHWSARQLQPWLPGRGAWSISLQRRRLGLFGQINTNPHHVAGRPLIAKTCRHCGLLLTADWFFFDTKSRIWWNRCKKCDSANGVRRWQEAGKPRRLSDSRPSVGRKQSLTRAHADRHGLEYTEDDITILADPDLSLLQKAIRTGRTYRAVTSACSARGFKSHKGLGNPERDQWIIDNPSQSAAS